MMSSHTTSTRSKENDVLSNTFTKYSETVAVLECGETLYGCAHDTVEAAHAMMVNALKAGGK